MAKGKGHSGGRGRGSKKRTGSAPAPVSGDVMAAADDAKADKAGEQESAAEKAMSVKQKLADAASGKATTVSGKGDGLKWAGVAAIVIAGIAGFYLLGDYSTLGRVIGLLLLLGAALFLASKTVTGASAFEFVKDSRTELRKVVWPTRNETMQTTGLILVVVVIVAIFIWILDTGLGALMKIFIGGAA